MQDCELCRPDSDRVIWKNERFYVLDAGSERYPDLLGLKGA